MYKVFFNDRTIFLGERFPGQPGNSSELVYQYKNREELKKTIERFSSGGKIRNLYISNADPVELEAAFRACFKGIKAGGGLVFNPRGCFLAIRRNGVWDLPKGKLEKGETFEEAALREVEEETGLKGLETVQPLISTYHTYQVDRQPVLKETQWFEMFYPGSREPVLQEKEGITEARWVKPRQTGFMKKGAYGSILDVLSIRDLL